MDDADSGQTARALVIAEPGRERIEVTALGPARLRLIKLIRAHFHDIHSDFTRTELRNGKPVLVNNLNALELMELEEQPGEYQSVKTLLVDERQGNVSTISTDEKCSVRINQSEELDRVASREGKERRNLAKDISAFQHLSISASQHLSISAFISHHAPTPGS